MKRVIFSIILSLSFIVFPFINKASALELSAGVLTWFCWWETVKAENDMDLQPTLLYGPVLSARLNESWSLAGVFLYGKFPSEDNKGEGGPDGISRFDSDISLNYNINRYLKLFGGGKLMGFSWDEEDDEGVHWSAGPGAGIGSTFPLTDSLYLLLNISGTYSWGKHDISGEESDGKTTININERGFNTNLSVAYYFASANTSVNLGFRYQYLFIDYPDGESESESYNFFGPTLSVVYSF
ncbi:MAG: hypothetical protein JXN64_02250 [Spirochaetes bacterium]|nr:hypothetical protein [Spirochaetota bacterium]